MNAEKHDYEVAAEELQALFNSRAGWQNLKPDLPYATPIEDAKGWKHRLWILVLNGQSFEYRTGVGIKTAPKACEIIASYCREYLDAKEADSFEEWASNFGYSDDSREAESIYRTCLGIGPKLRKAGLDTAEIAELAELSRRL